MVHGTQCICEICTCGRHQCPSDGSQHHHQQQHHEGLIGNIDDQRGGGTDRYYRKEFATIGNIAERAMPARPKDELSMPQGVFAQREAPSSAQPSTNNAATRSTFVTSAALRRRAQQSQIDFGGGGGINGTETGGGGMRSTYREQSERALQPQQANGAAARETRSQMRAAANGARPKTSDLWKREGKFEGQSVSRSEFAEKKVAERADPIRPRQNGPLLEGNGGREFQRETSNLRDFGPKRSERVDARRPVGSDLFKSEEPLERRTVNRDDYGQQGKGERFAAKPHESSDIWAANARGGGGGARIAGRGVNAEEYGRAAGAHAAERRVPTRPVESDILRGQGTFARESHQMAEFGPKQRGEQAQMKKHTESDIWKNEGRHDMDTVSRTVFKGAAADERAEATRPIESHILRPAEGGTMAAESVSRTEYGQKGRGDRFPAKKPVAAELWRREGPMAAEGTVNRADYAAAIDGNHRGERHEISWANSRDATVPLFDADLNPNQQNISVHRAEFVAREGGTERPQRKVPTEEGAELLRGDGTFMSETSNAADYQSKTGERFDAKRHEASEIWKSTGTMEGKSVNTEEYSIEGKRGDRHEQKRHGEADLWKREGHMEGSSVNRADYAHVRGERATPARPTESHILKGQGAFAHDTQQRAEFGPKRAERAEARKPTDSDLFRREGTMGEMGTVNRSDFVRQAKGDRYERRIPAESRILVPAEDAPSAHSTVSREEFGAKRAERAPPHRPVGQFRLDHGDQPPLDYTTVSAADFGGNARVVPPEIVAGGTVGDEWMIGIGTAGRARNASSESNLLQPELDMARWAREYGTHTHSQEQFGPKDVVERAVPVPHGTQLSLTEPGATFDSNTMYSDHFQVSPESFTRIERPQQIRPSTALRLSGNMDMVTGYRTDFQNKVKPCPAGELVESLKKKEDHTDTEHFQFHTINKGHRLYKSKENLATVSSGEEP